MQAVILAGGLGTRLRPLTERIPKVMVSVYGKPFLEYQLKLLKKNGIKDIVLCTGYLREQIESYFGSGGNMALTIRYSREENRLLGTGGALKQARTLLDDHFCVINGDTYLPLDYRELERYFIKRDKKAIMAVYDNSDDTGVKNNVELDRESMVVRHDKERLDLQLKYVEAGALVLKREVLDIVPDTYPVSLEKGLYPVLIQNKELAAYIADRRFYDIGTPEQLKVFEKYLAEEQG
jgi:NDP-sugar pyrophosphorylase family protein